MDEKRRLEELSVELELEKGRNTMLTSKLAEAHRKSMELESRLAAALSGATPRVASAVGKPRPPSWSPAGSPRRHPERPKSPLSELQQLRSSLKPVRRPTILPDESSQRTLLEKNKQLTMALLRAEAEYKRDRDRSNRMIHKLQLTVERLARDGEHLRTAAENDVDASRAATVARDEADKYLKLYQMEVRKRLLNERKSGKELSSARQSERDKAERLRALEREIVTLQRSSASNRRAWLGMAS